MTDGLAAYLSDRPLALLPAAARQLVAGEWAQAGERRQRRPVPGVAIIPVVGILAPRSGLLAALGLAVDPRDVAQAVMAAVADHDVGALILDIDSPGGLTDGVPEAAAAIREARRYGGKPIVAVANTLMASAAYWLAAQATTVIASPSALVGSIGVYTMHDNLAGAYSKLGIERTYISRGKYKTEGNETEPLSKLARRHIQDVVDDAFEQFTEDVALGRHTTPGAVASGYGEGLILTARQAVKEKLADRVDSVDGAIMRLAREAARPNGRAARFAFEREKYARR